MCVDRETATEHVSYRNLFCPRGTYNLSASFQEKSAKWLHLEIRHFIVLNVLGQLEEVQKLLSDLQRLSVRVRSPFAYSML